MSNYSKEKNFIIINLDGASGEYRLDINEAVLYGIKGSPVKTFARRRDMLSLLPYSRFGGGLGSNLEYMLFRMFDNCTATREYRQYAPALVAADRLDALNIPCLRRGREDYVYLNDHIKELVAYLKDHNVEDFHWYDFQSWCETVKAEKALKALGSIADGLTTDMYNILIDRRPSITKEEIGVCAYYLGRGKYWEYHNGDLRKLMSYLDMCRSMEIAPNKVNNFMREYCETKKTYELRKAEFDNKRLVANYAKHAKAWEFSYGNYIITIPTCGQDIVTEGKEMHHCVGGYVDRVVEGRDYICFVRHKDKPSVPYITCEVYTNGEIGQYFLAYDRHITSHDDRDFKEAFQNHLREVWGN